MFYRGLLGWALDHRWAVFAISVALLVGSLALMPFIGTGFMPETKENYLTASVEYPEGTKSEVVDKTVAKVERVLGNTEGVDFYQVTVGSTSSNVGMGGELGGTNKAQLFVRLDPEADTEKVMRALRTQDRCAARAAAPRSSSAAECRRRDRLARGGRHRRQPGRHQTGERHDRRPLSSDVEELDNVSSNLGVSRKQIVVDVNESKAAKYGLNAAMIAGTVRGLVAEQKAGSIKIDGQPTDVMYTTRLSDKDREKKMKSLTLTSPLGKKVKLTKVASVTETRVTGRRHD